MRTLRIIALAAVAGAMLFQLPAAPAAAVPVGGVETRTARVFGDFNATVSVRVSCPFEKMAISAGAQQGILASVATLPDQRTVEAVGRIDSGAPFNYVEVQVTCLPFPALAGAIHTGTTVVDGPPNTLRAGVVWCPRGYLAFAGGRVLPRPEQHGESSSGRHGVLVEHEPQVGRCKEEPSAH